MDWVFLLFGLALFIIGFAFGLWIGYAVGVTHIFRR